ncbi:MAG: NAD(P)-binding protein, partial [Chloroflexi bacterium]|nr:NAD(P)-binding protein [Chloroflexota bacterium]
DYCYRGERPLTLTPQEQMLPDLILHDNEANNGLRAYIDNMTAVMQFDAERKERLISEDELDAYARLLATAVHLAKQGIEVTVFEKNSCPGGRCDQIIRDGHRFDVGSTLLVMPLVYEAEFAAMGTPMHEMLDLQRVDPTYHLIYDGASQLTLTSDMKQMHDQLEAIEPGSFQGFLNYFEEGHRHYHKAMSGLVNRDFRTVSEFFALKNLPLLHQV